MPTFNFSPFKNSVNIMRRVTISVEQYYSRHFTFLDISEMSKKGYWYQ